MRNVTHVNRLSAISPLYFFPWRHPVWVDRDLRPCDNLTSQTSLMTNTAPKKTPAKAKPAKSRQFKRVRQAWQLQTAKAQFSELFRLARAEGPQLITRQGKDGVVMLPVEQFDQLMNRARQPKSLVQFFRESPLVGLELEFERERDTGRDVEL